MSTRANIIVKDSYTKLYFYRHSDGYPDGTMPTLEKFLNMIKEGKIRNNAEQSAGWLILLGAQEYDYHPYGHEKSYEPRSSTIQELLDQEQHSMSWKVGSIEPTRGLHSDIDYLYIVDVEKKEIFTCEDSYGGDFESFDLAH